MRAAPEGGLWWDETAEAQGTQGPTGKNPGTAGNERQPPNNRPPQTRTSTLDVGRWTLSVQSALLQPVDLCLDSDLCLPISAFIFAFPLSFGLQLFPPDNRPGDGASQAAFGNFEGQRDDTVADRGDLDLDRGQVVRSFDL